MATAIGATAARAKLLADHEEREMELLMATIIEAQVYLPSLIIILFLFFANCTLFNLICNVQTFVGTIISHICKLKLGQS